MISKRSLEVLQEIINLGVGKGAQVLNTLLNHHVVLSVPVVSEIAASDLVGALGIDPDQKLARVQMGYHGSIQGEVQLIFPAEAAAEMVRLIVDDDQPADEMDFIRQATLTEVGNIVINAVVGTLSNQFGFRLQYSLPTYLGGTLAGVKRDVLASISEVVILAKTSFVIQDLSITGNMLLFFSMPTFRQLEDALERYVGP